MVFIQILQRQIIQKRLIFLTTLIACCLAGCVTVPKATVEASQLVNERLGVLQVSHEATLEIYFDLTRERVEDFLVNQWTPVFLDKFIDEEVIDPVLNPQVLDEEEKERLSAALSDVFSDSTSVPELDKVVLAINRTLGDQFRGEAIQLIAAEINTRIAKKRTALLDPIDTLERDAITKLREAYVDVVALQSSVTGYLQSLSDVTLTRDEILKELGLLEARDKALEDILNLNDEIVNAIDTGKKAEDIICQIQKLLNPASECEEAQ